MTGTKDSPILPEALLKNSSHNMKATQYSSLIGVPAIEHCLTTSKPFRTMSKTTHKMWYVQQRRSKNTSKKVIATITRNRTASYRVRDDHVSRYTMMVN